MDIGIFTAPGGGFHRDLNAIFSCIQQTPKEEIILETEYLRSVAFQQTIWVRQQEIPGVARQQQN